MKDSIQALSPWPDEHQRYEDLIQRAIESHEQNYFEQKFLRSDGMSRIRILYL